MQTELFDALIDTIEIAVTKINERIDALERDTGVHILDDIDPERTDYKRHQLARHKNGLYQFDGDGWVCLVDSIDRVEVEPGDGKAKLVFAKSSGATIERDISFARPRKAAVKAN